MTCLEIVKKLVGFARAKLMLDRRNELYARNAVLGILGLESYADEGAPYAGESSAQLLSLLAEAGTKEGLFSEEDAESVTDAVMGALMISPKETDEAFALRLRNSSVRAMDWFYEYSVNADYVKKEKLDKNPRFRAKNGLIVTINLAKPEFRDPKKAASGNATKGGYPKCSICRENEGWGGRNKRTLRTVSLKLGGENWFWQYSPYGYFKQHGIAVNCEHTPMHVDKNTFLKLMDFVDSFPHYFLGCNAPLPRIGGSVLAHDHFQGGGERLPIFDAKSAIDMRHKSFPDVAVSVLDWFGTAVRLTGVNREAIAVLSEYVRTSWLNYRNDALGIIPEDADGVHSAVSPTVVKSGKEYEMTLILRNNVTSEQYPDGVFHAHPEFHVIKKESIGLIEAQGLFILPGRLKAQLAELAKSIAAGKLSDGSKEFRLLYDEITQSGETFSEETASDAINEELGSICQRILNNTAVFKTHRETAEFLQGVGFYAI